jgi:hypothetical protein
MFTSDTTSQSSSEPSSHSGLGLTCSLKQVTWGKTTRPKYPPSSTTHRKIYTTLDYFRYKLRQGESEKSLEPLFKRHNPGLHRPLQEIRKDRIDRLPEYQGDLDLDWSTFTEDLAPHTTDDLVPPPLDVLSDLAEDTSTTSTISTPPESIAGCDNWDTDSESWSDQWNVTPKLPSGWSLSLRHPILPKSETEPAPKEESCQPNEAIQTPGGFLEDLVSSLQYGLIICGLGFMVFLILACWTVLVLTCGITIASVFPAVLAVYGLAYLFTRTKYPAEWLLRTTIKIGGGLALGIEISLVIVVEFIGDKIQTICTVLMDMLPTIFLGISATTLFILPFSSMTY